MSNSRDVIYLDQTDFGRAMSSLRKRGGQNQRAYEEACKIIESLRYGEDVSNKITKHGEARIDHVVKYDLSNDAHRLVTIQTDNFIYLLFVGNHEDTDRWLERNRGLKITASKEQKRITVTHITEGPHEHWRPITHPRPEVLGEVALPFFQQIPQLNLAEWVVEPFLRRAILSWHSETADEDIEDALSLLEKSDPDVAALVFDMVCELREHRLDAAIARLEAAKQQAVAVQVDRKLEVEAVRSEINADHLLSLSDLNEREVQRLFNPSEFERWMLFLHPEQRRIVEADYDRSTVLIGVSGSGKTSVVVHRARRLAKKYPGERIGVLTLNRSLAKLINNLVESLCTPEERATIQVMALYDYLKQLITLFGPQRFLDQLIAVAKGHEHEGHLLRAINQVRPEQFANYFDPRSGETLDDTWDIFINQAHVYTQLIYLRDHLQAYQWSLDSETYLQEEFSLVRSAFGVPSRYSEYPSYERTGRAIPLPEKERKRVLDLLLLWEEVMLSGGMLDELGLTLSVLPERPQFRELPNNLRFRCLLIDEFQDFSTLDLALLRLIPTAAENGLFVTGDPLQKIHVKSLKLAAVGLDILSANWERITKNYRNSKQILKAASLLANHYGQIAHAQHEEVEILDPELAVRETAAPFVIAAGVGEEVKEAWTIASECLKNGGSVPWSVTIVTASPAIISVDSIVQGQPDDLAVSVDRISGDYTRSRDSMTVGAVGEIKGFEYTAVIIVGCGQALLPHPSSCREERWREALRFYVAMTRARDNLFLIHSGLPSEFLEVMRPELQWDRERTVSPSGGSANAKPV